MRSGYANTCTIKYVLNTCIAIACSSSSILKQFKKHDKRTLSTPWLHAAIGCSHLRLIHLQEMPSQLFKYVMYDLYNGNTSLHGKM